MLSANRVFSYGNVIVSGDLSVTGTKQFVQAHPTDTTKAISYVAIESGEALTIVRGTSRTVGGVAKVDLPEDFGLVTSDKSPLTVLLTVENAPALIYVKSKSKDGITVEVKPSDLKDYGDVDFSYQVTGVRDGFENHAAIIPLEEVADPKESTQTSSAKKRIKEFNERVQRIHSTSKARK